MIDPKMDRDDEPFCYFSKPTDVIGVMDGREGTMITPEGYLYTGFGEFIFLCGDPLEPIQQRVKTLMRGYLPAVEYKFDKDGIRYRFTAFAATLDGKPESPLMNFVRIEIQNRNSEHRSVYFGVATRYQNEVNTAGGIGDNRFYRPAKAQHIGQYEQSGVEFNPDWEYQFTEDAFLRDGKVMYLYPTDPSPTKMMTLKTGCNEPKEIKASKMRILPTTPVGIVKYKLSLNPGEKQILDFKIPYEPLALLEPNLANLRSAQFDDHLKRTENFWEQIFAQGIDISIPEEKVVNTFKANLIYDLIARDKIDSFYIQKVNEFQYDAFWLRDASYIVRMYDLSGYHEIARQCLDFFAQWQQPDGNFVSQGGQFDGWGQTMWAYGQHYRITRDKAFAEKVYPSVQKAVKWLRQARRNDPLGVMPVTTPGDNENITGHVTGHNFWALVGLKNVIAIAEGLGKKQDAEAYRQDYKEFHEALVKQLDKLAAKTGGYMPPGLDDLGGQDWGNMLSVYPEIILDPFDPKVTATLKATRAKYQEGIMTYGDGRWLHHYLTMKNTETEVIRGDQEIAIEELYALLLHTSATHAGFEFCILPWGTRDFGMNLSPHGWFSAKFRALLRNMLVREQEQELHLLSCISPEWVKDGKNIVVRRAPTYFGQVNFEIEFMPGQATLKLENRLFEKPEKLVLHLPWFMSVSKIVADGKEVSPTMDKVILPIETRKVEIQWTKRDRVKPLSYEMAVSNYKSEYRRRYEEFLRMGER